MTTVTLTKQRHTGIDNLRGLAIVLMIVDHVILVFEGPVEIRYTLTRLSMPLFFLISGHVAKRIDAPKLLLIGTLGFLLPIYVTFVDNPNVLFWYAVSVPIIVLCKRKPIALYGIVLFALTIMANYFQGTSFGNSYNPLALLALMAVGALIPRDNFQFANRLPSFLAFVGSFPLSIYVGHLLALETIS